MRSKSSERPTAYILIGMAIIPLVIIIIWLAVGFFLPLGLAVIKLGAKAGCWLPFAEPLLCEFING